MCPAGILDSPPAAHILARKEPRDGCDPRQRERRNPCDVRLSPLGRRKRDEREGSPGASATRTETAGTAGRCSRPRSTTDGGPTASGAARFTRACPRPRARRRSRGPGAPRRSAGQTLASSEEGPGGQLAPSQPTEEPSPASRPHHCWLRRGRCVREGHLSNTPSTTRAWHGGMLYGTQSRAPSIRSSTSLRVDP
jgi:hypothetical protein